MGGVIGGIANVIQNQDNINSFKDWFVYYNIGNLAGSTGAATSYYGSYGLSYTKIGGALGGMLKGGPAGFVEEFISKSLNSLYEGNSFGSSVDAGWDAGKEGFKWGTVLGGLGGGLDAVFKHRNFWNGAEIQDEVITPSQNLPGIGQRGDNNCVAAIGENVDASFGGNNTQEQLRSLPGLGGNPQTDPLDDLKFWDAYSKATGHKFMGDPYKYKSSVLDRILTGMKQGTTRVVITQNGSVGHEVVMSSIVNRTSTFINGTRSSRLLYYVFNPGNSGSFQRISRSSILNSANIFYIFK